jgi:hypothetical protein
VKIFAVGLAKSGTCSLAAALRILGYHALHDFRACMRITDDVMAGRYPPGIDRASAFLDWPNSIHVFPKLGALFPGSKFIVTDRSVDEWVNSRLLHVLHARVTGENPWRDVDTAAWIRDREELLVATEEWGAAHPDRMLRFDVKEGWAPLCRFLGRPIPAEVFPTENGGLRRLREILAAYESGRA